jgi:hypothetical protein
VNEQQLTNPLMEFMSRPPAERLRALGEFMKDPVWQALDAHLAMLAMKTNADMFNATNGHDMAKTSGDLKRILEIRQWPSQVIGSARAEIEAVKQGNKPLK